MAVLYGNGAFSILMLSTKNQNSSFLKKFFVFQKICFKVKVLKAFKIFSDCHIKTCRSLQRRAFWKSPVTLFRRTYILSVGFKIKPLRRSVFQCQDKNQPKFCRKICWKEQPFIFTVYLTNHIFPTSVFLNVIIQCIIEINWLFKHLKKVRSSQPAILVLNWIK